MTTDSVDDSTVLEANIRDHVAVRARELGGAPRAADVDITWGAFETPPGVRLFRARWIDHSGERALTGVCLDGEINTRPLDAIDLLLHRWRDCAGRLPDADMIATVCAFLLDADCRHQVVVGPTEDWLEVVPKLARGRLHGPVYTGGDAELPLVFFWLDTDDRPFRVEIRCDRDGRIAFESTTLSVSALHHEL